MRPATRWEHRNRASTVSGSPLKARRRGGLVLLTMSTPAPALVITTPTEVGGAPSMLSEAARDRGAVSVARRREGALYPKLRPGPNSFAPETVASNQRARLYGAMIELVANRSYEASAVAELCGLAGVSKRTLYERFPGGKRQCFLATYDIVVRRAETHILAAGRCALDGIVSAGPLERPRTLVEAFGHEVPHTATQHGWCWWRPRAPGRRRTHTPSARDAWSSGRSPEASVWAPTRRRLRRSRSNGSWRMARGWCAQACATVAPRGLPVSSRTYASPPPRHQRRRRTVTARANLRRT